MVGISRLYKKAAVLAILLAGTLNGCYKGPPQAYEYAGEWGTRGTSPGEFHTIVDVAIGQNDNVYVAEFRPGQSRVQYFTPEGEFIGEWGSEILGYGEYRYGDRIVKYPLTALEYANGIYVAPEGTVYVLTGGYSVRYFSPSGEFLGRWKDDLEGNPATTSIAVAPNGHIYICDATDYSDRSDGMVRYYTGEGELLGFWIINASPGTSSSDPVALSIDPDGFVYVVDYTAQAVKYFSPVGSFIGKFGRGDNGRGDFENPVAMAIGADGTVYVTEIVGDRALTRYFASDGDYVGEFGFSCTPPAGLDSDITGLAVASNGTVYVADAANHRVVYFRPVRTGFRFFR